LRSRLKNIRKAIKSRLEQTEETENSAHWYEDDTAAAEILQKLSERMVALGCGIGNIDTKALEKDEEVIKLLETFFFMEFEHKRSKSGDE